MLFISLPCLIALPRTSHTIMNKSGVTGHPLIVPDLRGKALNILWVSMLFTVGFLYMDDIILSYIACVLIC